MSRSDYWSVPDRWASDTRSGVHWSPMASLAAASRRTATSSRSVGKSAALWLSVVAADSWPS